MKKFSKREKFLISAILGVSILFLSDLVLVSPLSKRLKMLNQNIIKAEITLRKTIELDNRSEYILQEYKNIEKYLKLMGSDEEVIAFLLKEIEVNARQAGVSIINLKPHAQPKRKSDYRKYSIDLHAEGRLKEIVDFIYGVETSRFLLKIKSIALSDKGKKTDLLKAEMKITGIALP